MWINNRCYLPVWSDSWRAALRVLHKNLFCHTIVWTVPPSTHCTAESGNTQLWRTAMKPFVFHNITPDHSLPVSCKRNEREYTAHKIKNETVYFKSSFKILKASSSSTSSHSRKLRKNLRKLELRLVSGCKNLVPSLLASLCCCNVLFLVKIK